MEKNNVNKISFIATDGVEYSKVFNDDEIKTLNDNIGIIGDNMNTIDSIGSGLFSDNIDKDSLIKLIKAMNEYVSNLCGDDFFCLINVDEDFDMKKVYELYTNCLYINQVFLKLFSQIEIHDLTNKISDLEDELLSNESMDIDSYGYIQPQYDVEMNESSHEEFGNMLIESFRDEVYESYEGKE